MKKNPASLVPPTTPDTACKCSNDKETNKKDCLGVAKHHKEKKKTTVEERRVIGRSLEAE